MKKLTFSIGISLMVLTSCAKKADESNEEETVNVAPDTEVPEAVETQVDEDTTAEDIRTVETIINSPSTAETDIIFGGIETATALTAQKVNLTWTEVAGVSQYIILQSSAGETEGIVALANAGNSSIVITGLSMATTYTFKIRILDTLGRVDTNSVAMDVTTQAANPPAITGLSLSQGTHKSSGQNEILATVTFDDVVDVIDSPSIPLVVGSTNADAVYQSGDGSNTIVFSYAVNSRDLDLDGVSYSNLDFTSGSLEGIGGTVDDLTLPTIDTSNTLVVPSSTKLWLDASDSNSLNLTGPLVNSWEDLSGESNHMAASSGQEPTLLADDGSGRATLDFSAGSKYLRGAAVLSGTVARQVFIVSRPLSLSNSTSNCIFALSGNESNSGSGYGLFMESPGGTNGLGLRVSGNKLMNHTMDTSKPSLLSFGNIADSNVEDAVFHVNGTEITNVQSSSSAVLNTENISGVIIGGFTVNSSSPNATYNYNGYIYEILVFEDVLSDAERAALETYLTAKWVL